MMFQAQYTQGMKKKKASTLLTICLLVLLFFCLVNAVLFFFLLMITKSYATISTTSASTRSDFYTQSGSVDDEKPWDRAWESPEPTWSIACDTAHFEYDICYLKRPTVVDPTTSMISSVDPTNSTPKTVIKIRPYPRKGQPEAMNKTKELKLTTSPLNTSCTVTHSTSALIFSAGGFTGNVFHDFNEGWIPLYLTVDEHFVDRDVVLGIVDCSDWWLIKYADLFSSFTRHPIINLDKETATHCFPSAIVGLKTHGVMIVDPTLQRGPRPKTMHDFRALLAKAYGSSHHRANQVLPSFSNDDPRPKMAFLNRLDTRKLGNDDEVRRAAEDVGFDVVEFAVTRETPLHDLYRLIDSCHVFMGVHGQGLTHELFQRPGTVLLQIVPINTGWLADMCYGKLAIRLGLEYIVYEVGIEESSLKTDVDAMREFMDPQNPASTQMGNLTNWNRYMNQDVKVDVDRLKRYMKRAYDMALLLFVQKEEKSTKSVTVR